MVRTDDYKVILDSLPNTGVYVIREDNHQILYFNQYIKNAMPHIEIGMVCEEAWVGSCFNCPLQYIGDKRESRTVNYDNPFGKAVDVTAVRVVWGEGTRAFLLTITSHIEVANYTFYRIIRGNLTDDTYDVVKTDQEGHVQMEALPAALSAYLKQFGEREEVFEEDRKRLKKVSDFMYLKEELSRGREVVSCNYRKRVGEEYRWHMLEVIPDYQYREDRQKVVIYAKDVHDAYHEGLERQETNIHNQERLAALIRSQYRIMNTVSLDTGICERLFLSKAGNLDWSNTCDYEELVSKAYQETVFEEDKNRYINILGLRHLREQAEKVQHFREEVCQYRLEDESFSWEEDHVFYIRQKDEVIVHILCKDITEEKLLEEKTSMERKERATIIQSLSSLFFASYYINLKEDTFQKVSQYKDVGEVLGDRRSYSKGIMAYADTFVHPDDREEYLAAFDYKNLQKTLTKEHPFVAVEFRKINGGYAYVKEGWIRATAILADMEGEDVKTVLYVAQDVTESKEKEEHARKTLKDACEAATQANTAKSDFMSRMSHDIRTPMNAIMGMTTIARAHLNDQERVKDCLNKIAVSSRHLLSLINEVLDMSKIESGKISLSEEKFYLPDLVQNLLTLVGPSAKEKNHQLEFHIADVKHKDVIGDVVRLQQVFINILGNSIKYTPPGGKLTLEVSEKFSQVYGYGCYEFVFEDNGIGMDEVFLKKIFEPFSRAEDSRVSKIEGTGLGMAIAQNIVHLMNGNIHVDSEKNKGSKFTVTVFLKQQNTKKSDRTSSVEEKTLAVDADACAEKLEGRRVLLAEDNELNREIAIEIIGSTGVEIEVVENGEEAVRQYLKQEAGYYDLIFMDIQMPVMNGHEASKAIRGSKKEDAQTIPIIAMTANAFAEDAMESQKSGMNEHMSKPLDFDQLMECMQRWLISSAESQ